MTGLTVVTEYFSDQPITIRSDGYWNLTLMCQSCGKKINDYLRLNSTGEFLKELCWDLNQEFIENPATESILYGTGVTGFPATEVRRIVENFNSLKLLVEINQGGVPELQGTWGHELVALDLAAWAKPKFRVWVFKTVRRLLREGEVKLQGEVVKELRQALGCSQEQVQALEALTDELDQALSLSEYQRDRLLYTTDELKRDMSWHRMNSWGGADR